MEMNVRCYLRWWGGDLLILLVMVLFECVCHLYPTFGKFSNSFCSEGDMTLFESLFLHIRIIELGSMFFILFLHNKTPRPVFEWVVILPTSSLRGTDYVGISFNYPVSVFHVWYPRKFFVCS